MEENFPKPCKKLRYELGEMPCIDIIVKLYERGLDHVIEQIVINLDYLSLTRAENVSRSWHFILSSSRIWEMFVKTKLITGHPLFKRIFNLLKIDEAVSPEKCLRLSFRQMPEAIGACCRKLEDNWMIPQNVFARVIECEFLNNNLPPAAPPTHWQMDDDFIALRNEEGLLRIWSRKTYKLEYEIQIPYGNFDTSKNLYVLGDSLVLFLRPDGVIQVFDLMENQVTFEITELKGAKIVSLYFSPENGILVSSCVMTASGNSECGSLITVWKQCKKRKGRFVLQTQHKLPGINVLQILGWACGTFGLLCKIPRDGRDLHVVQIYMHRGPFKLKSEIQLEENYRLDWADGFLVIAFRRTIKLYDSSDGVCIRTIDETPMNFSEHFCHVSVCSTAVVVCYTLNEDEDDERTDIHVFKMSNILDSDWIPHSSPSYLLSVPFPMEKLKINELQIVGAMLDVDSVLFQLVEFYPACANCGLYKLGMAETFAGSRVVLRCEDCLVEQYCSTLCLRTHHSYHKNNDCNEPKVVELVQCV